MIVSLPSLSPDEVAWLTTTRRDLHAHPELSHHEERTAARVAKELGALGLTLRTQVGGHGVVADLAGTQPGPTIAYRADMDALPILEESDAPYRSCNAGVMHACGHDVHTTVALGVARQLAAQKDQLRGRVRFLFQPAEEAAAPPGQSIGAEAMALEGAVEGVDAVLAMHVMPTLEAGQFGMARGAVWASSDVLNIKLQGKTAHAAYPHTAVDTMPMVAAVIQGLLALPGRNASAVVPCVLSLGTVRAGTAHNIIPGEAELSGILRTFDPATRATMMQAIERLVEQTAAAHGGRGTVVIHNTAKPVINDGRLEERVAELLRHSAGDAAIAQQPPQMGAEDFSAFSTRVPGVYFFLGVRNEARGIVHGLHTARFDVDESCLPFAVTHASHVVLGLLESWPHA